MTTDHQTRREQELPSTLLLADDEPNAIIRALNNAYYLIADRSDDEGPGDVVANCILHELLDALASCRLPVEGANAKLIEALRQQYGYRWYDMVKRGPDGESAPGPTQYSFKHHPLIKRTMFALAGTKGVPADKLVEELEYAVIGLVRRYSAEGRTRVNAAKKALIERIAAAPPAPAETEAEQPSAEYQTGFVDGVAHERSMPPSVSEGQWQFLNEGAKILERLKADSDALGCRHVERAIPAFVALSDEEMITVATSMWDGMNIHEFARGLLVAERLRAAQMAAPPSSGTEAGREAEQPSAKDKP